MKDIIYFAKVKSNAIIPSKNDEDGCYDVYACFDEDFIEIKPQEIKMIPTGIASAFDKKYRIGIRERGSTGTKGITYRSGQIDSGYRGEWFVPINNTINKPIYIAKDVFEMERILEDKYFTILQNEELKLKEVVTIYPYKKAICQCALEFVPDVNVKEISYKELQNFDSVRGTSCLGDSGK